MLEIIGQKTKQLNKDSAENQCNMMLGHIQNFDIHTVNYEYTPHGIYINVYADMSTSTQLPIVSIAG